MAQMEALGDIDAGIIHAHGFAVSILACAPFFRRGHNGAKHFPGEIFPVEKEIQITAHAFHPGNFGLLDGFGQLPGDHGRAHAQRLAQLKAGESVIPHGGVRRHFQQSRQILRQPLRPGKRRLQHFFGKIGDALSHVHKYNFLPYGLRITKIRFIIPYPALESNNARGKDQKKTGRRMIKNILRLFFGMNLWYTGYSKNLISGG